MPNYLNCEQAAEIAQCSFYLVREAIKAGDLVAYKIGKGYIIDPEDLTKWIKSQRVKPKSKNAKMS